MGISHIPKAALIGHPLDANLFRSYIHHLRSDKWWSDELLIKLFEWAHAFKAGALPGIRLDDGKIVDGSVFMVPFLPEMREIRLRRVIAKVEEALALAAEEGCCVAALGAFTSIVLQGLEADMEKKYGLRITSGNTLTAAVIIRSVENVCDRFGLNIGDLIVGVVGASGDIGSACTIWFGSRARELILTARGMQPLEEMADRNRSHLKCPVKLSINNYDALSQADVVIFVTSAYTNLFTPDDFRPWTIVCDASAPLNVDPQKPSRPNVFLYHGGILSLPVTIDTGFDVGLASPYHFYACQIEGLLIALDDHLPCSWGRGNTTLEKLSLYLESIERYQGLRIAFSSGPKVYSEEELSDYGKRWTSKQKNE